MELGSQRGPPPDRCGKLRPSFALKQPSRAVKEGRYIFNIVCVCVCVGGGGVYRVNTVSGSKQYNPAWTLFLLLAEPSRHNAGDIARTSRHRVDVLFLIEILIVISSSMAFLFLCFFLCFLLYFQSTKRYEDVQVYYIFPRSVSIRHVYLLSLINIILTDIYLISK